MLYEMNTAHLVACVLVGTVAWYSAPVLQKYVGTLGVLFLAYGFGTSCNVLGHIVGLW